MLDGIYAPLLECTVQDSVLFLWPNPVGLGYKDASSSESYRPLRMRRFRLSVARWSGIALSSKC